MSVILRILLLTASIMTASYIARKLRKAQMQVDDATFWLLFSLILVIMSIFPELITGFADLIGVQSPVNFVFLVIIFLLFIRCFILSVRVPGLEEKVKNLVEESAVRENIKAAEEKDDRQKR